MRKARDFWIGFEPETIEDYMAAGMGPNGAYIRMVVSYWDMAASFVENFAIDRKMFYDSSMEFLVVYTKIEPLLPKIREIYSPNFAVNLEKLALGLPDARNQIEGLRARIKSMLAARKAATANAVHRPITTKPGIWLKKSSLKTAHAVSTHSTLLTE